MDAVVRPARATVPATPNRPSAHGVWRDPPATHAWAKSVVIRLDVCRICDGRRIHSVRLLSFAFAYLSLAPSRSGEIGPTSVDRLVVRFVQGFLYWRVALFHVRNHRKYGIGIEPVTLDSFSVSLMAASPGQRLRLGRARRRVRSVRCPRHSHP